jgi:hypothetical protein
MHRSGTSFAANALRLLGVSLGDPDQLLPAGPDNPAGYWENRSIKEIDDEVLAELGGSWDQPPVLVDGWERDERLEPLRCRASDLLQSAFGDAVGGAGDRVEIVAWKDPRLSLLLPFWRTVTPISTTVLIVRDPLEVAASLGARNGMGSPQAAVLWLRYVLAGMRNDPGHLLLRQADFFDDLPSAVLSLSTHLGLERPSSELVASIGSELDPEMRHHVVAADAGAADPVMRLALAVWNDGDLDPGALPDAVATSLAEGWLRPPVDGEQLAEARAKTVKLEASLRRRELAKAKLDARRAALDDLEAEPAPSTPEDGRR